MLALQLRTSGQLSLRLINFGPCIIQAATITGRQTRGKPLDLPKPFPYQEKRFRKWHDKLDPTILKVSEENARIIVVEGPIGVGKSAVCQHLAEEFDMHYIPQPTMDIKYIFPSGFDVRTYDDQLHEDCRTFDHKNFCLTPKSKSTAMFQINMMNLRFFQLMDAICHLLNTGQGVILERNFFSDYVFLSAMREQNYVSEGVEQAYFTILRNTKSLLMPPHLIIYLDISVPVVQERIRTRNYSYEQNSPALTTNYLQSLEKFWKNSYLKEASEKSEILVYDWTDGGDIDIVIDDIEEIDLDIMRRDNKFTSWWFTRDDLFNRRCWYTNFRNMYNKYFYYPWYKLDEVFVNWEYEADKNELISKNPETQLDLGYNFRTGDSIWKILFQTKTFKHRDPKYHLQYNFEFK